MDHVSNQTKPEELVLPSVRESLQFGSNENYTDTDELFQEAVSLVITHQQVDIVVTKKA